MDPIGDFLTRLRNAIQRHQTQVVVPSSKMLVEIAKILEEEGFIAGYSVVEQQPQNSLEVELKYVGGESAIRDLKRQSKPGIRRYIGYRDIPLILKGMGITILSTPKGVMTGKKARASQTGGEYLCTVY